MIVQVGWHLHHENSKNTRLTCSYWADNQSSRMVPRQYSLSWRDIKTLKNTHIEYPPEIPPSQHAHDAPCNGDRLLWFELAVSSCAVTRSSMYSTWTQASSGFDWEGMETSSHYKHQVNHSVTEMDSSCAVSRSSMYSTWTQFSSGFDWEGMETCSHHRSASGWPLIDIQTESAL